MAVGLAVVLVLAWLIFYLGSIKNFTLREYLQLSLDGLQAGSVYALIALGFVVIHSVTGIINFAQGEFVMLGAMLSVTFYHSDLPLPPAPRLIVAIILAVTCTTILGGLIERITIYPARSAPIVTLIIITIGVTIALRAAALLVWSTRPYYLPAFSTLQLEDLVLHYGEVRVRAQSYWIWGVTAVTLAILAYFFEFTMLGKGLRACAVNRRAAELMGISPSRMSLLSFALAAGLGAIGGAVLAPAIRPTYDMGLILGLKGFVSAIMGGLVSLPGAVLGGLILGVAENIGAGVTAAGYKDIIAFIILILLLLLRPQGIIGGRERAVESGG